METIRELEDKRLDAASYTEGFFYGLKQMRKAMLELSVKEFKSLKKPWTRVIDDVDVKI